MQVTLNFLQNKYLSIITTILVILSSNLSLNASELKGCEYRVFNIKTTEKVSAIELLTQIADTCNFSLVIKDTYAKTTLEKDLFGVNINNLSLDDVLELIITDNDLYYEYNKNFLRISALNTKTFKVDYITSVRQGTANFNASVDATPKQDGAKQLTTDNSINSTDSFDFWSTISSEILSIMNTGSEEFIAANPIVNQNAGLITTTGTKKQLDRVGSYIETLEKNLHKQVLIDVNVLAVEMADSKETGVDWSKFQLQFKSSTKFNNSSTNANGSHLNYLEPYNKAVGSANPILNPITEGVSFVNNKLGIVNDALFTVDGLINFLNTEGETKVISSPKVLTINNQQSLITIGDNINYRLQTEYEKDDEGDVTITYENYSIFIGVLLNITPQITDNNEIILRINPSVSDFKYSEDNAKQDSIRELAPDTAEKKLSTVVKVQNGNTIILGGLITTNEGFDNTKVPLLGDIPLLGEAFKHSAKTKKTQELIFVITPRIIGPKDNTKMTLKDLGFSKRIYEQ